MNRLIWSARGGGFGLHEVDLVCTRRWIWSARGGDLVCTRRWIWSARGGDLVCTRWIWSARGGGFGLHEEVDLVCCILSTNVSVIKGSNIITVCKALIVTLNNCSTNGSSQGTLATST